MGVIQSIEDAEGLRCIDVIQHADSRLGFKDFAAIPRTAVVGR